MLMFSKEKIDAILAKYEVKETSVIPILQDIQKEYRYLPKEALEYVCAKSGITPARITGVSTFYTHFRHTPVGKHFIQVCHGTACHVKGAPLVTDSIKRHLKIAETSDTDKDRLFTVDRASCFGCCTLAPVVKIDGITYGHITPQSVPDMISGFLKLSGRQKEKLAEKNAGFAPGKNGLKPVEVRIGLGSCCVAGGSQSVREEVDRYIAMSGANAVTKRVGCVGVCSHTPLVEIITPQGLSVHYTNVKPEDIGKIAKKHIKPGSLARRLAVAVKNITGSFYLDDKNAPKESGDAELNNFLEKQKRITLEYSGQIDPIDIEEYISHEGFKSLENVLKTKTPDDVIEEIKESGLRGRGGAGFPTWKKWALVSRKQEDKYIICNGDEGDPGAFMDRMLLESYPYRVLEGMAIAAYAVGASKGILYIRDEYPLAIEHIEEAITVCKKRGMLGFNLFGTGVSLNLSVKKGAGAFVCGEETALMESVEGRRGNPRYRPPFPAEKGLFGKPTLINNVETYANVPWIMRKGAAAFAGTGTENSKGTKVFALAGKITRGGLIEVPMGITIRDIVENIGGGPLKGRKFKAVQIGGPSGGCIPESLADTKVDYDRLTEKGAIMGSGGMVVLDDTDCMVDMAKYFLEFTQDESCGKCTFCRIGTKRMKELLEKFTEGKAREADIIELEDLAVKVKENSLCGLGKTAPNPVLSTLKYFKDEYEAHIKGKCPAGKCKALIKYNINDKCIGCTLCAQNCPGDAIAFKPYEKHEIDQTKCIKCDTCKAVCKSDAVDRA